MSVVDVVEVVGAGVLVADDVALVRKRRVGAALLMLALLLGLVLGAGILLGEDDLSLIHI